MKDFAFDGPIKSSGDGSGKSSLLRASSAAAILTKPRKRPSSERLDVEAMEPRILLSADPIISLGGALTAITLDLDGDQLAPPPTKA